MVYDVIILGGGPAGCTAGLYAGRANLKTLLLERLAPGGQLASTDMVDNYPGFPEGVNGFDLALKIKAQADRFGVETVTADVTELDLRGTIKTIRTSRGDYQGRTVLLATGAAHRKLQVPGEARLTGKGVSYCATCDGGFYRNKTVAVIGGGDTAAADALYLSKLAKKVYLIHRRDKLRASNAYLAPLIAQENIEFIWNAQVTAMEGEQKLTGLLLQHKNGREELLPVDGVFLAVGMVPNTQLFAGKVALDDSGYVLAGENTKTNMEGVYAIGDVRSKPLRQVVTAVADGATAISMAEAYLALQKTE